MSNISSTHGYSRIYSLPLALFTDMYQLVMGQVYFDHGVHQHEATFHRTLRRTPFGGTFAPSGGLGLVIDYLQNLNFPNSVLDYLSGQRINGQPVFTEEYLRVLGEIEGIQGTVHAMPEGTMIFSGETDFRFTGPLLHGQLIETTVSNIMNFQTLIGAKFLRIKISADGDPVLEFAPRRAQGLDGALSASRAAYTLGLADATSHVQAGYVWNIPIKGTHAHSSVLVFDGDRETFMAMAESVPENSIFLVDTVDTVEGVKAAIEVLLWLKARGYSPKGIRLDSGDLNYLSQKARKLLDEAGLQEALIYASNDLDEFLIKSLKEQGAKIVVWAVGTRGGTAHGEGGGALQGVYKLTAIKDAVDAALRRVVKLSENQGKVSVPGILQVRRFYDENGFILGDMIHDTELGINDGLTMVDQKDSTKRGNFLRAAGHQDLLVPVFVDGEYVYDAPTLSEVRDHVRDGLERLHSGVLRLENPHQIPVGLERQLFEVRHDLILAMRGEMAWETTNGTA